MYNKYNNLVNELKSKGFIQGIAKCNNNNTQLVNLTDVILKVIKHEFFDRKQGDFFIDKKKQVIKKHRTKMKLKNIVHTIIKNSGYLISHLRNHHILIAKKN